MVCYICFLTFGGADASKSVYYPLIQSYYHLQYDFQGILVCASSIGYTLFSLVVGYLTVKIGVKWTLILGFFIMSLAFGSGILIINLYAVFGLLIIAGVGQVFLDVGVNTWATVLFQSNQATMMNLLHCFYGLGATVGPIFTGWISSRMQLSYRGVFSAILGICLVGLVSNFFIPSTKTKKAGNSSQPNLSETGQVAGQAAISVEQEQDPAIANFTIKKALCHPLVWIMGLAEGCIAGTENITMNWAPFYLRDLYGWDPETRGARFVSGFFLVYTISRVVSGFIFDKVGTVRTYILYLIALIGVFVSGFLLGEKGTALLMSSGFFIAPLFPTTLTFATTYFGPIVDRCTCAIMFIYMITSQLIQLLVGVVMKHVGVPWGYRTAVVLMVILMCLLLIINRFLKKKEKAEEEKQLLPNEV